MVKENLLFEGVRFQPLTMNAWGDFELLFNGLPACQMCWCMYWRTTRTRLFGHADQNKQEMHACEPSNGIVIKRLLRKKNSQ